MHYKDGTEVKLGDVAKFPMCTKYTTEKQTYAELTGIVVNMTPGAETCNIGIAYLSFYPSTVGFIQTLCYTTTAKECELVWRPGS